MKNKSLFVIFIVLFLLFIGGSIKILSISEKQMIDDFTLVSDKNVKEADAFDNVEFTVDIDIDDGSAKLLYKNEQILDVEMTENVVIDEHSDVETLVDKMKANQLALSNVCYINKNSDAAMQHLIFKYNINADDETWIRVRALSLKPLDDFQTDDEFVMNSDNVCEVTDENVYVFNSGYLYSLSKEELLNMEYYSLAHSRDEENLIYCEPIYSVPDEVDILVTAEFVEDELRITGVGCENEKSYSIFVYRVDAHTGEVIEKESYRKNVDETVLKENSELKTAANSEDNTMIVTVMLSNGQKQLYKICFEDSISFEEMDITETMTENSYIAQIIDVVTDKDTVYICYAKGITTNESFALGEGYFYSDNVFDGICVMAIKNKEVIYQGQFESELLKNICEEDEREAVVNNITMKIAE